MPGAQYRHFVREHALLHTESRLFDGPGTAGIGTLQWSSTRVAESGTSRNLLHSQIVVPIEPAAKAR